MRDVTPFYKVKVKVKVKVKYVQVALLKRVLLDSIQINIDINNMIRHWQSTNAYKV